MKYAITLTKGNDEKILYLSDSKEDAIAYGDKKYNELMKNDGILCCIKAEFDENNNRIGNRCLLFHSW